MARTRILTGADRQSGAALRHGATGLTVGVVALLITGAGGTLATGARLLGGVALAAYALAATAVWVPVVRAALRARPSFERALVVSLGSWFPVVIWADVAVVLSGKYRFLDAVGAALLLGVLGQALFAAMSYFAPELWTADRAGRDALRPRLERAPLVRALAPNVGIVLVVVAAAMPSEEWATFASRVGWGLVLAMVLGQVGLAAFPNLGVRRTRSVASRNP